MLARQSAKLLKSTVQRSLIPALGAFVRTGSQLFSTDDSHDDFKPKTRVTQNDQAALKSQIDEVSVQVVSARTRREHRHVLLNYDPLY